MALPQLWQSSSNYKISTDVYEGPLDLLLQLIEQAQLDITKLSLASVTDQYLEHLNMLTHRDPTEVSAFLVIAAKLLYIKSSILLPSQKIVDGEIEEDVGDQLARQLLAYKFFKEKAQWLDNRQKTGLRSYYRVSAPPVINEKLDLSGITTYDLVDLLLALYFKNENETPLSDVVAISVLTLKQRLSEIIASFRKNKKQNLSDLLGKEYTKLDLIVTFLALLELIKNHALTATQSELFSDISLESNQEISNEFEIEL